MAHRTVGVGQTIRLSGTATTSSAFTVQSNVLRVVATDGNAYVAIGTDPVATATDYLVTSSQPETLAMLRMSQRVVGITTGATTVLEAPEGTQMPFNIGDRVTLDYEGNTKNDSNYTTLINDTKVVGKSRSAGVGGDFLEKITVEANTTGIITAYTSNSGGSVMTSHKLSAIIADGETANSAACLYFQQVQRTG